MVEQSSQFKRFQLTLADIDKPELSPVGAASQIQSEATPIHKRMRTAKARSQIEVTSTPIELADDNAPTSDAIKHETLNILSDLIDLNRIPQSSDTDPAKKGSWD